MPVDLRFGALALVVLLAFTTEASTGFGTIVITLTLGAHLYGITELLPIVVPLSLFLTTYIVSRHHDHIEGRLLLTRVLPLMLAGGALGYLVAERAAGETLQRAFGAFVVVVSLRELYLLLGKPNHTHKPLPQAVGAAGMFGAGIIHGIYASGGPLLVYVLTRLGLDKRSFRSTLACVWLSLNSTLTVTFLLRGRLGLEQGKTIVMLVPVVVLAIVIGEFLHGRLDERRFRIFVFSVLLLAGGSIVF